MGSNRITPPPSYLLESPHLHTTQKSCVSKNTFQSCREKQYCTFPLPSKDFLFTLLVFCYFSPHHIFPQYVAQLFPFSADLFLWFTLLCCCSRLPNKTRTMFHFETKDSISLSRDSSVESFKTIHCGQPHISESEVKSSMLWK